MKTISVLFAALLGLAMTTSAYSQTKKRMIVIAERGEIHESFVAAALEWLDDYSDANHLEYDLITETDSISTDFLARYDLFLQLNFPPYRWSGESKAAFEDYIDNGKGAWIGFHHAALLGEFDGYGMWGWFSDFLGGIRFKDYIAERVDGEIYIEDKDHPIFKSLPEQFNLPREEWYTFDRNPRDGAKVLATVDEDSYTPPSDITMGDHPVIWTNPTKKAKNVYFLFGHHGGLFEIQEFTTLFENTLQWALKKD